MCCCPPHTANVTKSTEDLDRATADAFALGHVVPAPGFRRLLSDELGPLVHWDLEPVREAFGLAVPPRALGAEAQPGRPSGSCPCMLKRGPLDLRPPLAKLVQVSHRLDLVRRDELRDLFR